MGQCNNPADPLKGTPRAKGELSRSRIENAKKAVGSAGHMYPGYLFSEIGDHTPDSCGIYTLEELLRAIGPDAW